MKAFKDLLQSLSPVEDHLLETYFEACEETVFPKKHVLTQAGQIQRELYFVMEGVQKSYYLDKGKEHVIAFTYRPWMTGIPESFFSQTPSRYFLETITESKLLRISYEKHNALIEEHRSLETAYRKLTEMILGGLVHRLHELMADDMETRFKSFVQRSPHLLQMVNHKDIASYLRMDATNFSRLLGKIKI